MKNLLPTLLLTLVAASSSFAADTKTVRYNATMTGVVCSVCKKSVREAFAKLGANKIEFVPADKPGQQKVSFEAASASLTREEATKSLGEAAKEFSILSLDKAKP